MAYSQTASAKEAGAVSGATTSSCQARESGCACRVCSHGIRCCRESQPASLESIGDGSSRSSSASSGRRRPRP